MTTIRWLLLTPPALGGLAWVTLVLFADRFRRSFGASANSPATLLLPILLAALLSASLLPGTPRLLLHTTALTVLLVTGASLWIFRTAPFLATGWLVYAGCWLGYYRAVLAGSVG